MMRGIQRSTYISLIFVLVAGSLGVLIGAIAGYFGSYVDNVLMRMVDVILTVPILVFIIVIAANFPQARSPIGIALFIALLGWMDLARIVRSQFLSLREKEYVEAAHALGASNRRIILKHLIPNSLGQIIVWATLGAAIAVITEAALSYLGYGVQGVGHLARRAGRARAPRRRRAGRGCSTSRAWRSSSSCSRSTSSATASGTPSTRRPAASAPEPSRPAAPLSTPDPIEAEHHVDLDRHRRRAAAARPPTRCSRSTTSTSRFPTEDGVVHAVRGVTFSLPTAARCSASSASPAPASRSPRWR